MGIWIIVPDKIIELIRNKAAKSLEYPPTAEAIKELIEAFIDDELNELDESLYSKYSNTFKNISLTTFKRALNERNSESSKDNDDGNGVFQKSEKEIPPLLELLCYYACKKSWGETIVYLNIETSKIRRRYTGKDRDSTEGIENINPTPPLNQNQPIVVNNFPISNFSKSYVQVIDDNFWNAYLLPENKKAILGRYYTHADSSLIKEVIANNEAVPPNDFILVADTDGNVEQRTITEIIKSPVRQGVFLIKIILDGGVGKTTFLYWIARHFHDSYNFISISYLGSLDIRKVIQQAKAIKKQNNLPISFLIDNVSDASVSSQFERLIKEIKSEQELFDTLFIIAERESRYQNEFIDSAVEMLFGGNILSIINIDINRELLFERLYTHLLRNNPNLKEEVVKQQVKEQFLGQRIQSISENIFYLIKALKLKNVINYTFDWEDWGSNLFEKPELKYLYAIVACFYQFGIKVSSGISTKVLGNVLEIDIVNAINRYGGSKSPIQLSEDARFLSLKHEHLANWFLDDPKNKNITLSFFRIFLTEIDNETNAKLLRKVRKVYKRDEFKSSILANEFGLPEYVTIIKDYVELAGTSQLEKVKMLMEQGLTNVLLGADKDAIISFNAVLKIDENNNHAKDQLARIYIKSPNTYVLAFNYYYEIYKNDGSYALKHLYALIKKCNEEGVLLNTHESLKFSISEKTELLNLFIETRFFDEAIQLINTIDNSQYSFEIAKSINLIAHFLPFSNNTIELKRLLFKKALQIKSSLAEFQSDYKFEIDYAVFLYRIREFSRCTKYLKAFKNTLAIEGKILVDELFIEKIRVITKLFFSNIPSKDNLGILEDYLREQCWNAAAFINKDIKNPEIIIKGILLLHTVRYHSRIVLPTLFNNTTVQLGYAYTYHAQKPINNLSVEERRNIAENYYDMALNLGADFSYGDCLDMIRNLQNCKTKEKSFKSISLINLFFRNPANRRCPGFYRMRGNANAFLGNYSRAIEDYKIAEKLIPGFDFSEREHFINDQAFLYNNLASVICDMYESQVSLKDYDLKVAHKYISKSLKLKPDFSYAKLTLERVRRLME
ncbi:MAG: hypothetical protein JST86_09485 [Bacteroidetes bacterium]|nr:hypothetical protein [Bacteroidota bacterium]